MVGFAAECLGVVFFHSSATQELDSDLQVQIARQSCLGADWASASAQHFPLPGFARLPAIVAAETVATISVVGRLQEN